MSKIFEMLQQAQRDQELLKQSAPQAAIHSRNLDALHRAGRDQQLFDIPSVPEAIQTELAPPPTGFSHAVKPTNSYSTSFWPPTPRPPERSCSAG